MNRKIIILFLITTGLLSACQKNLDIFVPDAGQLNAPDTSWYGTATAAMPVNDLKNKLMIVFNTDSIQVNSSTSSSFTSAAGLQCIFPPLCCAGNTGQLVTGSVHVETMLLKKKGDMIRMNTPTTSNNRLLVSGGEIFLRLKKDSTVLQLAPGVRVQMKFPDAPISTQMKYFRGDETGTQQFNWVQDTGFNNNVSFTTQYYEVFTNHLRWVNCDYFYDTTNISRVTIKAELASYFTNANTIAYTVFKDFRSVVGMYGDVNSKKFSTGKLPVGKAVTVVVISKQGNDYFLGYENTVTTSPISTPGVQSVSVKPVIKSLPEIIAFLNTL